MRKNVWILLPVLIFSILTACGAKKSQEEITSVAQLNETGRKIGVASGTTEERKEGVRLSEPAHAGEIGIIVRDTKAGISTGAQPEYSMFEELTGKTVSMLTGAPFEELVKGKNPDVGEFTFFNSTPE